MSLAEAIEQSDWRMDEADLKEFTNRVLFDDEKIIAAFWLGKGHSQRRSIVFTSERVALESQKIGADRYGHITPESDKLMSIPYRRISMHTVDIDLKRDPSSRTGMLRLWVAGYYNETGLDAERRWINISGEGILDLNLLSRILSAQIAKT